MRWVYAVAFFIHLLAAWSVLLVVRRRVVVPAIAAWVGVGVLTVWAGVMVVVAAHRLEPPRDEFAAAAVGLVDPAVDWVAQHGGGPVLVTSDGGLAHVLPALVDALDRAGEEPLVTGPLAATFPAHQRHDGGTAPLHLVVAGSEARARLLEDPAAEVVAEHPGVPGDERQPALTVIAVTR